MVKWEVYQMLTARKGEAGEKESFASLRALLHFDTKGDRRTPGSWLFIDGRRIPECAVARL